jgi:hypothetical protein
MSHTVLSPLELELVEDVEPVEPEVSTAGPVEDEAAVEASASVDIAVTSGCVTPPKLDAPPPPPQAETALRRARVRGTRIGARA